jgi:tRNA(Arg) A34 adenosine deaminase TadA
MPITATDLPYLRRCVGLAAEALEDGVEPFGSVLVDAAGEVLFEDRNRVRGGDATQHPEFAIARWATTTLTPQQRLSSTVYTSGEHCPMCAAAHGWVGLGRIAYVASAAQLTTWLTSWAVPPAPVAPLPIDMVAPGVPVDGPVDELLDGLKALHYRRFFPR